MIITQTRGLAALLLSTGVHMGVHAASTIEFAKPLSVSVMENAGEATLIVARTGDLDAAVSVDFVTLDGTAKAGSDYTTTSGTLTFAIGQTNQTIRVPILNDALPESTERLNVTLSNPSANATLGTAVIAVISVTDNDAGIQVEFGNYWADEGSETVTIGVTRGEEEDFPTTVDYTTADGTAKAGSDYEAAAGTVTLVADEKVKLVVIRILNDGLKEANETFRFAVSNPSGATALGTVKRATVTIKDNDPGVHFDEGLYWVSEDEGAVAVKVRRGNDANLDPFSVDYVTADMTAIAGEDYAAIQGTLAFAAGEVERTISVPITLNTVVQADSKFKVALSNASAGTTLGSPNTVTITVLDTTGTNPHRFDKIAVLPDGSVRMSVAGSAHKRFDCFFDLVPIDVSTDLSHWTPLQTLASLTSSGNALVATEVGTGQARQRFYRVPAQHFFTTVVPRAGPFAVGRLDRWLTDPTRRNRFYVSTNSSFRIAVWYPAVPKAGAWPLPCADEAVLRDSSYSTPAWMDRWPLVVDYAAGDLDMAGSSERFPVVLLSVGWTAVRHDLFEKADELASHGYIVVAPDHFDTWGVVLPDGRYSTGSDGKEMSTSGLRDRVADLRFILRQMEEWDLHDSLFSGRLDLGRTAAVGFSWGGATALEFCRVDPRWRVAVALDPGPYSTPELQQVGPQKPFLTIHRSDIADTSVFEKALQDAIWFQISGTTHADIGGAGYFPSGTAASFTSAREVNRTVNAFAVWFLDKYSKGLDVPMPPLKDHPRIFNFKQK